MSEADIHFEFYRHLANAVSDEPQRNGIEFGEISPEYGEDIDGFADIVLFESNGSPAMVIEAKAPSGSNRPRKDIDPYAPKVIRQAFRYAGDIGAPYFATFNGDRLVVFDAYEEGVPLLQRSTKSYEITSLDKFADTFLDEIARIRAGDAQWDADDDAFVERIKSLHEKVSPELEVELAEHLETNDEFHDRFEQWTNTQGIEYGNANKSERSEVRSEFAEQAAYLLINKVLFYKILESSPTYADELEPMAVSPFRVKEDLEEYFTHVVEEVDFEAIFEHDEIYSEIPLDSVSGRVRDFVIELDDQNLTQFDSDVIGRIYEGVIPSDRRHEMGEYYTPPAITELITRLTIEDSGNEVLDPACGSGGFLVSAYNRIKELKPEDQGGHEKILSQIHGVDINRFPAHLSAINLSIQDLTSHTEIVNVEVSDFFDIHPDTLRFGRVRADAGGSEWDNSSIDNALGGLDAIVGNPPYIRQQNINEREKVRDHLSRVGGENLSKMSDIYAYFFTHSTEFLDVGGRLGFITSDRWLDTRYGKKLQKFILDNYTVDVVIKFNRQAFEDALVGACVVVLTKEDDATIRNENVSKFIRVYDSLDIDELESVVRMDQEPNQMVRRNDLQIVTRQQQDLYEEDKWSVFFNAPAIYFDVIGQDDTIELSDTAEISRGITSGANDFYYGRTKEWEELGLDEYVEPLLKATGQVDKIEFDENAAKEWAYLSIHDLVETALDEDDDEYRDQQPEEKVKQWLAENGHTTLVDYIEWGEDQGFPERQGSDMQGRAIWFDLEEHSSPPIVMMDFTWREHRVIWNDVGAIGTNQFYYVVPDSDVDPEVLCGILNSRLAWLMCELKGRWAEGQGMARSRLMVYETEQLPIPDPRKLSEKNKEEIRECFRQLINKENKLGEDVSVEATEQERDALDRAVLSAIGMEDRLNELKAGVERLVLMREQAAGEDTEVLIDRPTESEIIELEGVNEARESTRLSDFN